MARRVLLTTPRFLLFEEFVREYLVQHDCQVIEHGDHDMQMKEDSLRRLLPEADGLVTALEQVTAGVLAAAPRLRVITATGVGYDHIDVPAATRQGITVCISAGSNHQSVAELTIGLMIALARQITHANRLLREGRWERLGGPELQGKILGIVGLGRVGKAVALLGRAFGMRILANDVVLDHTFGTTHAIEYVPLPKAPPPGRRGVPALPAGAGDAPPHERPDPSAHEADRLPHQHGTGPGGRRGGAGPGAPGRPHRRGRAGRLRGRAGHPPDLVSLPNVILTPHVGGSADEALARMMEIALLNVTQVLDGAEPVCRVN